MSDKTLSLVCSKALQDGIEGYATGLAEVLGDNLRGVYLYGSLAWGCYHPSTSDLDIIVITREVCAEAQHPAILRIHEELGATRTPRVPDRGTDGR
jgi:hypothetical protein